VIPDGRIIVQTPNDPNTDVVSLHPGLSGVAVAGRWLWVTGSDGRLYQISLYTKQTVHTTNSTTKPQA
jgi:hypothetical protein